MSTLACLTLECQDHLKAGGDNLILRKTYGEQGIRYLQCKTYGTEFIERKGTPLWNSKIDQHTFVKVTQTLCEGNSISATTRLCHVHHDTVEPIVVLTGKHARNIHDCRAVDLQTIALQSDERHGFYGDKSQPCWEATTIDPYSKFLVSLRLGNRDETLIRALMLDSRNRLVDPQNLAFFTEGGHSYAELFPEIFGKPYRSKKTSPWGRPPKVKYSIPRTLAHVQLIKHREGRKLKTVETRYAHGTMGRIKLELARLGHNVPNTSAVERQNGTARQHTPHLQRKGLAFARKKITRVGLAELIRLDYNWVKTSQSLRVELPEWVGRRMYL